MKSGKLAGTSTRSLPAQQGKAPPSLPPSLPPASFSSPPSGPCDDGLASLAIGWDCLEPLSTPAPMSLMPHGADGEKHPQPVHVRRRLAGVAFGQERSALVDWLSEKLKEDLKLVQKARLGPGYDNEAVVLNLCVTCSDARLTWEADPRHAELAVAELDLQAARPQTSPGSKVTAPPDHEELEPDGQKPTTTSHRLAYLASNRSEIAFACKESSRSVKARRRDLTRRDPTRLKRVGRYLLHAPRAVLGLHPTRREKHRNFGDLKTADHKVLSETKQSSTCNRGAGLGHPMDPVVSVQNKNFAGSTKKLAKVLGAR